MTFDTLIADAAGFYRDLSRDNTKAWWDAHKPTYDRQLKAPALALLAEMTPRLADLVGEDVTPKLFRPHRDVRFSNDKRPYQEHLHMMWTIKAGGRQDPAFFFGIGTDYVTVGSGVMGFDKPVLDDWRKFIDLDAKRLAPMFANLEKQGFGFWEPALKRVPQGFAPDHPLAAFLRMKGAVCTRPVPANGPLADQLMLAFKAGKPFTDLLVSVVCA